MEQQHKRWVAGLVQYISSSAEPWHEGQQTETVPPPSPLAARRHPAKPQCAANYRGLQGLCGGEGKSVMKWGRRNRAWSPTASSSSLALCGTSTAEDELGTLHLFRGVLLTPPVGREGEKQENPAGVHHRSGSSQL